MTNEVVEKSSVLEDPDNTDDPSDLDVTDYPIEGEELENDTNSGL